MRDARETGPCQHGRCRVACSRHTQTSTRAHHAPCDAQRVVQVHDLDAPLDVKGLGLLAKAGVDLTLGDGQLRWRPRCACAVTMRACQHQVAVPVAGCWHACVRTCHTQQHIHTCTF